MNNCFACLWIALILLISCRDSAKTIRDERIPHVEGQRNADLGNGFYLNPVLGGDYPDPSVLKVDDTWYMTHSSFTCAPGLLIWKSNDLVNWEPVCNALNTYLGSVFAPDFIEHHGKFYIYFPVLNPKTSQSRGFSNFVVVADNPEGPWSDPIDLKVGNIDPGHVVDDDGNRYLYLSHGQIVSISNNGLSVTGEVEKVYDGWQYPENWLVEGFCLESPKSLKKDGYYYLTSAEGGTAGPGTSHMVVSARSKTPFGPWEHSPYNPVIKTESADETWLSTGHGTVFEGPQGQWYCMFHGYQKGYYTLGRQTLMEPIEWTADHWFKRKEGIKTDKPIKVPNGEKLNHLGLLSDDFNGDKINIMWRFVEEYDASRFSLKDGALHLKAKGVSPADCSPMLIIPTNESYEIETELTFTDGAVGGLTLFYSAKAYTGIRADKSGLARYKFDSPAPRISLDHQNHVFLKIRNIKHQVAFYYSLDGKDWKLFPAGTEVSGFHHNTFGEFLSLRAGLFAAGDGEVVFNYFNYKGLD